ncbi:MAG: rhodanese-like domain-containing protein [Candidatus Sericytochromatia bacterium]|nr:rhodanese-like domain-containing protein [Candidatus Tanganyikabacteria bacterium]
MIARAFAAAALLSLLAPCGAIAAPAAFPPPPWQRSDEVAPGVVAGRLAAKDRPVVIQIGYRELYDLGHVPGSRYAGPGEEPAGLANIRRAVGKLQRDRELVIYCGCCPSRECANLIPAFKLLRSMGFKKLRVVAFEDDFTINWKNAGLPVATPAGAAAAKTR